MSESQTLRSPQLFSLANQSNNHNNNKNNNNHNSNERRRADFDAKELKVELCFLGCRQVPPSQGGQNVWEMGS